MAAAQALEVTRAAAYALDRGRLAPLAGVRRLEACAVATRDTSLVVRVLRAPRPGALVDA